jgi:hypothetical protein
MDRESSLGRTDDLQAATLQFVLEKRKLLIRCDCKKRGCVTVRKQGEGFAGSA